MPPSPPHTHIHTHRHPQPHFRTHRHTQTHAYIGSYTDMRFDGSAHRSYMIDYKNKAVVVLLVAAKKSDLSARYAQILDSNRKEIQNYKNTNL